MSRKIFVFAFMMLITLAAVAIPMVIAQTEPTPAPVAPETTFAWVFVAWLIYAVVGLLAGVTTPKESFDALKLTRSFIVMVLTGITAIALRISPANVETEFGGLLTLSANIIVNTAPGVTFIYLIDKLWKLFVNLKTKIEAARGLSATGPPKP
jgi:hypothetical protein